MCNDGGGESSGHIASVHQPFKHLSVSFHYVFNTHLIPPVITAHLQQDLVFLKAAIDGISIYSMYSVLQNTQMKLNPTFAVFQTTWSYLIKNIFCFMTYFFLASLSNFTHDQ